MSVYVLRGLGVVIIALVFIVTLIVNWPLSGVASLLEREGMRLEGVSGTLPDGVINHMSFQADSWPLALGPINWQLAWPPAVRLQVGQTPSDWQIIAKWRGQTSQWTIIGGDMAALDLSGLPFAIDARWEGGLTLVLDGKQCVASEGALTTAHIALRSPTPISLGQGRLHFDCSTTLPRVLIDLEDGDALDLTLSLALASPGEGRVQGSIAPSHPLAQWYQLLKPDASGTRIDEPLRW